MRNDLRSAPRSADKAGGGIWAGGPLIIALLLAIPGITQAQSLTVTATVTDISCFGKQDGAIDITISGGQAPYAIEWSNSVTDEDVIELAAGFYAVVVKDALGEEVRKEFTLVEPLELQAEIDVHIYPNGYNLSCYQCYNGSISVYPQGGTAPYTYLWQDGAQTQYRYNLGPVQTNVTLSDAHGCSWVSQLYTLTSPERSDWTMTGNSGSNPATQYLGTSDNKDLVLRTNGVERLRLKATGELRSTDLSFGSGYRLVVADSAGTLKSVDQGGPMAKLCFAPWTLCGTNVNANARLGTLNAIPLRLISDGQERMHIDTDGKVGIGCIPPVPGNNYKLYVEGGIMARECRVTVNTFYDTVFLPGYHLLSLDEYEAFIRQNGHLPHIPAEQELKTDQGYGIDLGDMQMRLLRTVEEQALYILELKQQLEVLRTEVDQLRNHR